MNNFWKKLRKPFVVLAPMAGYTDSAFRFLCKKMGADVVVSELISADAIAHGKFEVKKTEIEIFEKCYIFNEVIANKNHTTAEMLSFFEAERPFVVQLFGKNPDNFAKAARWIDQNLKPDGIDINMGCPARKVVGSDHGAALLKNPKLASDIIEAIKRNTSLPVSVKTRLGWCGDDEILEFAPVLADAGISAITIHGRTYKDGFLGRARWNNFYNVKQILGDKVVVIGNGDVDSILNTDRQMLKNIKGEEVKLDGLAIGRASFGRPWIFCRNKKLSVLNYKELGKVIQEHAEIAFETKGEKGIIEFRKHLLSYLKGFPEAKKVRIEAVKVLNIDDVKKILALVNSLT